MNKKLLAAAVMFLAVVQAQAQIGAMKLVGNNTKDYAIGFGAYVKTGFPVSEAADLTIELAANVFPWKDYETEYGTIMCPLKVGYRYTLNGTGQGFYIEPQAGYNVWGATAMPDEYGNTVTLKYHGVVLAAGTGYLFTIARTPFDLNLRYETVMAHGGSNNMVTLGISRYISFGKRDSDY